MLDHEKAIQHAERHGGHREEIEGGDRLAMVLQKGQPFLIWVSAPNDAVQIAGHAAFGNPKAKLL